MVFEEIKFISEGGQCAIDNEVQYFDILREDWKAVSIWRDLRPLCKFLAITTQIRGNAPAHDKIAQR